MIIKGKEYIPNIQYQSIKNEKDRTCWTWIHSQSYVTPIVYLHWKLSWLVTVHRIM